MGEIKYLKEFSYEIIEKGNSDCVFYFFMAERAGIRPVNNARVVLVYPYEWTLFMTPWKYKGKGMDKTGGAEEFMKSFTELCGGLCDRQYEHSYIGGYSLGGLMALYMAYRCSMFEGVASVSGSMWYPGALSFFAGNSINENIKKAYISIGEKEALTKSAERAKVEYNTSMIVETLQAKCQVVYEKNPGGHFTDIAWRIEKAIMALT